MATTAVTGSRVFNSSLTSRRFPALRTLTAEDVEVMVMPAPSPKRSPAADGSGSARLFNPPSAAPTVALSSSKAGDVGAKSKPFGTKPPPQSRPPFRPSNPHQARDSITEVRHGYVGMHSPFELAHKLQMLERAEARKYVVGPPYVPPSGSKARAAIAVNYYLNSPDAETIEAERRYIHEKAQRNMVEYYRRQRPT